MATQFHYVCVSLVVALLLIGFSSFLSAAGYLMLPAQAMETGAELRRSQATGNPITDHDIRTHLGRLESSRRIYGLLCGPNVLAAAAIVAALILLAKVE